VILYLYAVVEAIDPERLIGVAGIGGEPLETMSFEQFTVVGGQLPGQPAITAEALQMQDRVVRNLHDRTAALLPMRFGSGFASADDARAVVATHAVGLRERLERVRGREQMTMRVLGAPGALGALGAPGATGALGAPGAEYLRARARPAEIVPLLDAVAHVTRATIVERGKTRDVIATVYQLIDRGTSEAYRAALASVSVSELARSVHVSGPAPCYAFG
jgi:hypothetical protein